MMKKLKSLSAIPRKSKNFQCMSNFQKIATNKSQRRSNILLFKAAIFKALQAARLRCLIKTILSCKIHISLVKPYENFIVNFKQFLLVAPFWRSEIYVTSWNYLPAGFRAQTAVYIHRHLYAVANTSMVALYTCVGKVHDTIATIINAFAKIRKIFVPWTES